MIVDTALAPDPASVKWINPRVRAGEVRKVITGIPGKTGIVYTLDRKTGQFLWARETTAQNVIASINTESGAGTVNPDTTFTAAGQTRLVCPSQAGGKNFPSGTYSPQSQTMYFPLQNTCMKLTSTRDKPSDDDLYAVKSEPELPQGTNDVGTIEAIAVATGKTVWKYEQRAGMGSLTSTAGGLLFGGDASGRFRAFDLRNGKILWEVNLGSQVTGYPVTFAVNGRQFVAVSTGGSLNSFALARLTPQLQVGTGNNLFVFALPR
jgi:alcohol dehydrogenase (cytochrome c)